MDELVIGTHELPRRAGERRRTAVSALAPAGLGLAVVGVPEGSEIRLDLVLESVVEGVLVRGTAGAHVVGQCARCLNDVGWDEDFAVAELFYYPEKDADEDALRVVNDTVDLNEPVTEAVVLGLPFAPLCRPDCAGLCPRCGADLNETPGHRHEDAADPRWAALAAISPAGE